MESGLTFNQPVASSSLVVPTKNLMLAVAQRAEALRRERRGCRVRVPPANPNLRKRSCSSGEERPAVYREAASSNLVSSANFFSSHKRAP